MAGRERRANNGRHAVWGWGFRTTKSVIETIPPGANAPMQVWWCVVRGVAGVGRVCACAVQVCV